MRSRLPLYLLLFTGLSVVALPSLAHATVIPYWGPLVPPGAESCPAAWGSLVQLANNLIAFGLTIVVSIVAPLMLVYIGGLLIFNGANPGTRSEARSMLLNLVIGIVLALAAYLIVDFLLTSLTSTGGLNAWTSQIFNNGATSCIHVSGSLSQSSGATNSTNDNSCPGNLICGSSDTCQTDPELDATASGAAGAPCTPSSNSCASGLVCDNTDACDTVATNPDPIPESCATASGLNATSYTGTLSQCSSSSSACSVSTLEGDGLSSAQANAMSCIAVTESSGNPSTPPYNVTHPGSNSSACGTFQITQTTWNGTATGACSSFATSCENAACNAQVAATLVNQSGYSSWTCSGCNAKAAACVQTYGSGS